jgi:hypothetical protein
LSATVLSFLQVFAGGFVRAARLSMKVGDLVRYSFADTAQLNRVPSSFTTVVIDLNCQEEHPNKMDLAQVLWHDNTLKWLPRGFFEVLDASR